MTETLVDASDANIKDLVNVTAELLDRALERAKDKDTPGRITPAEWVSLIVETATDEDTKEAVKDIGQVDDELKDTKLSTGFRLAGYTADKFAAVFEKHGL